MRIEAWHPPALLRSALPFVRLALFALGTAAAAAPARAEPLEPVDEGSEVYAWFLNPEQDPREVRYCIRVSPEPRPANAPDYLYWPSPEQAANDWEKMIDAGVRAWRDYFRRKGLSLAASGPDLALRWHRIPACDGSEDLVFYFGRGFPEVEPYLRRLRNPRGFAHREAYDENRGWGRGFLWDSDRIPEGLMNAVTGTLVHEIGHVLGMGHVRGTVMDENFVAALKKSNDPRLPGAEFFNPGEIDGRRELLLSPRNPFHIDDYPGYSTGDDMPLAYRLLTGIQARKTVKAQIAWSPGNANPTARLSLWETSRHEGQTWGEWLTTFTVDQEFSRRSHEFLLSSEKPPELVPTDEAKVLRRLYRGKEYFLHPCGFTWAATLTTEPGQKMPVIVNRNLGSALEILLLHEGRELSLFRGSWWSLYNDTDLRWQR